MHCLAMARSDAPSQASVARCGWRPVSTVSSTLAPKPRLLCCSSMPYAARALARVSSAMSLPLRGCCPGGPGAGRPGGATGWSCPCRCDPATPSFRPARSLSSSRVQTALPRDVHRQAAWFRAGGSSACRRCSRKRNTGTPISAVKTPTGNCIGLIRVRAALSASTSRLPPSRARPAAGHGGRCHRGGGSGAV